MNKDGRGGLRNLPRRAISVSPGQSLVETLVFNIRGPLARNLRLVVPFAAFGRAGQAGFWIPESMIDYSGGLHVVDRPTRSSAAPEQP